MDIYTKKGDRGMTSLMNLAHVSKSDDRIALLGSIDELTSHLGLIKADAGEVSFQDQIERIQANLITIMAGIADRYNVKYKLPDEEVQVLEDCITSIEDSFPREKKFVHPGKTKQSARIDIARTVARRAERQMTVVHNKLTVDARAQKYLNRLSDYLYMNARLLDYLVENERSVPTMTDEAVVQAVLENLGQNMQRITLEAAKRLIEKVEEYSKSVGLNAVISVCGPDGNAIAVHVMDGSYLASFSIAMNKAYTAVAVKMSTKELGRLAMPGETFYGIDKADNGRMIIFGGGVPLVVNGTIIGGLGVSGGTAEQDADIAEHGLLFLQDALIS
ncbi:MAG: cob(I)yrinic acid a,c-diamide adenosyltransferase [Lachnospiraceae bacterium]